MGQCENKSHHHRYFHWHKKRRYHFGGNHLPALGKLVQQSLRQQGIQLARIIGTGQETEYESRKYAYQPGAQFNKMRNESFVSAHLQELDKLNGLNGM
jgi:hypothetical protein